MTDLKTTFAGLSLRNPIIISSSGLTNSAGKNKRLAEAGAGAIVLKSLFEEQIMLEADQLKDPAFYPEASDYLEEYIREHKLAEYLTLIKESKKECNIPIIASINCYSDAEWIDFAKQIQEAGADALEINILALQSDVQYTYGSFEQRHIDILRHIKRTVSIPVIMKLGASCAGTAGRAAGTACTATCWGGSERLNRASSSSIRWSLPRVMCSRALPRARMARIASRCPIRGPFSR